MSLELSSLSPKFVSLFFFCFRFSSLFFHDLTNKNIRNLMSTVEISDRFGTGKTTNVVLRKRKEIRDIGVEGEDRRSKIYILDVLSKNSLSLSLCRVLGKKGTRRKSIKTRFVNRKSNVEQSRLFVFFFIFFLIFFSLTRIQHSLAPSHRTQIVDQSI